MDSASRLGHRFDAVSVQPILALGPTDDHFERQANRVAGQVVAAMASPDNATARPQITPVVGSPAVQRAAAGGAIGATPAGSASPGQAPMGVSADAQGGLVSADVAKGIEEARGFGSPLPIEIRQPAERALGADFSKVRVHTSSLADRLNRQLNADAFAYGRDLFFRYDTFEPDSLEGERLIAHELTHVVQQRQKAGIRIQRGKKRARDESDDEDDANDMMAFDSSEESEEEDSSDKDWAPGGGSQRPTIDPFTVPINVNQAVDPATFAKVTTWSNARGVQARAEQQGSVTRTKLSGMSALPPGKTAKRAPLEGKVRLHSDKKGVGGGRKHNPNDTHSTHTAGMAMLGVPSEIGLGTGHDASAQYNRKYFPTELKVRAKPGREWKSRSEVETEALIAQERVAAIMDQPNRNPKLKKERLLKRLKTYIKKNPETSAIKRANIVYKSDRGERIPSNELGRDVWKGTKAKWFTPDYDPEESSGDEDVLQGTSAGIRGRDSGEGDVKKEQPRSKKQKTLR